jgi:hypothetical protein
VSASILNAQIRLPDQGTIGSSVIQDTLDSGILPLDTPVVMKYVLMGNPEIVHVQRDSFTWKDTKFDPLRFDQAFLGNLGSPVRSLAPSLSSVIGYSSGWDQYDPYYMSADSFRYYHQDIPVAKVKYSQGNKDNTFVKLDFGRKFAKGLSLSLSYDRMNQLGVFNHQHQKNTSFCIGVWHHSPSGRYDAFYNFLSNAAVGEENGGIDSIELYGNSLFTNAGLPVNVLHGLTTHKHRSFLTKQILHLLPDSTGLGFDLWLQANYSTGLYKYVDEDVDLSIDYYTTDYFFDQRGIRQFTFEKENQLSAGISLPWSAAKSTIQTSLRYRSISVEQEPGKRKITELFWEASGDFQWIKALQLKGRMSLGLGQASGSFLFRAEGILNSVLVGKFSGYWSIMGRNPYLVESSLFVNQQLIYQSDLRDPLTNDIGVAWIWDKQNLNAGINWLVFDNYIYFNEQHQPAQLSNSFSLRRFFVNKIFDFNWFGLKGNLIWQPSPKRELAIPEFLYTAGLYGRIKIFNKKVTLMPGLDFTFHDGYTGVSYFPVNGRYFLTNEDAIPDYMRIDAALGLKIRFLKIFARMDNIKGLWDKKSAIYQAAYYPHFPAFFRIGIEAGFFN